MRSSADLREQAFSSSTDTGTGGQLGKTNAPRGGKDTVHESVSRGGPEFLLLILSFQQNVKMSRTAHALSPLSDSDPDSLRTDVKERPRVWILTR